MANNFESGKLPKLTESGIDRIMAGAKEENQEENLANLDREIVDFEKTRRGDAIIISPEALVRIEELKNKMLSEAGSWSELYAMIAVKGTVTMAGEAHSADKVLEIINDVRAGKLGLNTITRTDGLREKVKELLNQETE